MKEVRYEQCPLRLMPLFLENSVEEVNLVQSLKRREARFGAGETLIFEGQTDALLDTLLDGWACGAVASGQSKSAGVVKLTSEKTHE